MAKTIKFNLICDNTPVRTIEDLQNNYVKINVEPRLKRISGVGKAHLLSSHFTSSIIRLRTILPILLTSTVA